MLRLETFITLFALGLFKPIFIAESVHFGKSKHNCFVVSHSKEEEKQMNTIFKTEEIHFTNFAKINQRNKQKKNKLFEKIK